MPLLGLRCRRVLATYGSRRLQCFTEQIRREILRAGVSLSRALLDQPENARAKPSRSLSDHELAAELEGELDASSYIHSPADERPQQLDRRPHMRLALPFG